ncbi:MAG: aldo/keto reductase [Pirellulaceae bacterium]
MLSKTLSPIIFGATSLGNLFRAASDREKSAIVQQWMSSGVSPVVIDSAGKYGAGLSLEVIGRELSRLGVAPEDVMISNKLAWRRIPLTTPEPTFEPGVWIDIKHDAVQDISYDGILRCWEEGNRLLGNYEARLVSVHDPDEYLDAASDATDRQQRLGDIIAAYRALVELRDAGQVAGVGVGAKNWRVIAELDKHCDLDWVMFANSLTILEHPPELVQLIDALHARDIAVVNSALFHGGFLLGGEFYNYRKVDPTLADDAKRLQTRQRLMATCADVGYSMFDVGVAFGKSHPGVTSIALSSSRADRVSEHVRAAAQTIPAEAWAVFRQRRLIDAAYPYV